MERDPTIPESLRPLVRATWIPTTEEGEGPPGGSRFGGRPWLPDGADWPRCPNCSRSLQLFAQIDLASAPGDVPIPRSGLLQLFYCTSTEPLCEDDLESYSPFGAGVVARRVEGGGGRLGEPLGIEPFPARRITGWTALEDAPIWEEREEIEISDADEDALIDGGIPRPGEKWLGWACWVQGPEAPACRSCGETMAFLLQIDSEENVPWMFGDAGIGHLFACLRHPDEMSFHWACG